MSKWSGSWGPGCCRRARFRRRRRRRRSYRSGTFTLKSGLACWLIWYIICPCRSPGFNTFQHVPTWPCQFKTFPSGGKKIFRSNIFKVHAGIFESASFQMKEAGRYYILEATHYNLRPRGLFMESVVCPSNQRLVLLLQECEYQQQQISLLEKYTFLCV